MHRPKPSAAKATPAPRKPERVYLFAPELGVTRDFDPAHAARLVARGTWQPVAAPDSSASA